VSTDISEEHIASIFKVEKIFSARNQQASRLLATCLLAENISLILKFEAICSSESSLDTQQTTGRYISEVDILHNHRYENLKSYKFCSN
jgi:hypothetical protein